MNNPFNLFLIFFSIFLFSCSERSINSNCLEYKSQEEEFSAIQVVGNKDINLDLSSFVTTYSSRVEFSGNLGEPANHEGLDLINDDEEISDVPIHAIAEGTVIYARTGCPSSTQFSDNTILRECGAGWGNHLVVDHGDNNYSRLTVPPGIWFGFQGLKVDASLVLNIANIPHDPFEVKRIHKSEINYNWS